MRGQKEQLYIICVLSTIVPFLLTAALLSDCSSACAALRGARGGRVEGAGSEGPLSLFAARPRRSCGCPGGASLRSGRLGGGERLPRGEVRGEGEGRGARGPCSCPRTAVAQLLCFTGERCRCLYVMLLPPRVAGPRAEGRGARGCGRGGCSVPCSQFCRRRVCRARCGARRVSLRRPDWVSVPGMRAGVPVCWRLSLQAACCQRLPVAARIWL